MLRAAATTVPREARWRSSAPSPSETAARPDRLTRRARLSRSSADHFGVVERAPGVGAHLDQDAGFPGAVLGGHRKIHLAHLRPEVADRHGANVALRIRGCQGDRALDAHVTIRRRLGLRAQAHPSGLAQEPALQRCLAGDHADEPSGLVVVPDRNRERAASGLGDGKHADPGLGQERLALGPRHRVTHAPLLPVARTWCKPGGGVAHLDPPGPTRGRRRTRVPPPPFLGSARRSPPCAPANSRAIASPRPDPRSLVVKKGAKTASRSASGIPGPRSDTAISAAPSSRRAWTATSSPCAEASMAFRSTFTTAWRIFSLSSRAVASDGHS